MQWLYGYVLIRTSIIEKKTVRRTFLEELGKSLTNAHNTRRSEQSDHTSKGYLCFSSTSISSTALLLAMTVTQK
jgi:hypothetical protein